MPTTIGRTKVFDQCPAACLALTSTLPTSSIQTDWTDHLTFANSEVEEEGDRHQDGRVHELLPQPLRLEGDAHPHPRPRRRRKDHTPLQIAGHFLNYRKLRGNLIL